MVYKLYYLFKRNILEAAHQTPHTNPKLFSYAHTSSLAYSIYLVLKQSNFIPFNIDVK